MLEYCNTWVQNAYQTLLQNLPPQVASELANVTPATAISILASMSIACMYLRIWMLKRQLQSRTRELQLVQNVKANVGFSAALTKADKEWLIDTFNELQRNVGKFVHTAQNNIVNAFPDPKEGEDDKTFETVLSNFKEQHDNSLDTVKDMHEKSCDAFKHALDTVHNVVDRTVEKDDDDDEE